MNYLLLFVLMGLWPICVTALLTLAGHRVRVEGPILNLDWGPWR